MSFQQGRVGNPAKNGRSEERLGEDPVAEAQSHLNDLT